MGLDRQGKGDDEANGGSGEVGGVTASVAVGSTLGPGLLSVLLLLLLLLVVKVVVVRNE